MSILQRLFFLIFALLNASLVMAQAPETRAKLTEAQVRQTVHDFLQKTGQPVGNSQTAQVLTPYQPVFNPLKATDSSSSGKQSDRWHMTIRDVSHMQELEVSDTTGQIVYYFRHNDRSEQQLLETPIPKAQAIAQATTTLVSAGVLETKELVFSEALLLQQSATREEWHVSWMRMYGDIPYREQGVNVSVNSQTGEVTGFSVNFHTPPPDKAIIKISRDQADEIAKKRLAEAGLQFANPAHIKMEVVQPNSYWQAGGSKSDTQPYAKVAWTCYYDDGTLSSAAWVRSYEVWVDAETGSIIGGQYIGHHNFKRLP